MSEPRNDRLVTSTPAILRWYQLPPQSSWLVDGVKQHSEITPASIKNIISFNLIIGPNPRRARDGDDWMGDIDSEWLVSQVCLWYLFASNVMFGMTCTADGPQETRRNAKAVHVRRRTSSRFDVVDASALMRICKECPVSQRLWSSAFSHWLSFADVQQKVQVPEEQTIHRRKIFVGDIC